MKLKTIKYILRVVVLTQVIPLLFMIGGIGMSNYSSARLYANGWIANFLFIAMAIVLVFLRWLFDDDD